MSNCVCFVTGGVEHADGLYMMADMPMAVDERAITVEEVMQANFQNGWPNSEAVVLQLERRDGAQMNWKQLLAKFREQD